MSPPYLAFDRYYIPVVFLLISLAVQLALVLAVAGIGLYAVAHKITKPGELILVPGPRVAVSISKRSQPEPPVR